VTEPVKSRRYQSSVRMQRAAKTRRAILDAARDLFIRRGYTSTTVAQIAMTAGVNVDTLYASVGPKPVLFRLLIETAISGADEAVPGEKRDYVQRIRAATSARVQIAIYAEAVTAILARLAPLTVVLRDAAVHAPEIAAIRDEISARRAANMRRFVDDLAAHDELRPELDLDETADVIWAMTAAEFYLMLTRERGWPPERYEAWLVETWSRLLCVRAVG
jgi:AcrR family transcriptional regulator